MAEHSGARLPSASDDRSTGKVGIVTVTYNSASVISDFLRSLEQQSHKDFLLYAVDNASKDGTPGLLRQWNDPRLVLIENADNIGIAAADNQGIRKALAAGCDTVLFLNNDVVFGPELFSTLLDGLETHRCDITVPLIYFHEQPSKIWAAGGSFEPMWSYQSRHGGEGEEDTGQYARPVQVQFAPGCCILVRREVFEQIGLIDERYFVYAEDTDFMYRALRANVRTFLIPEAKLWHKVSTLTGGGRSDFTLYYGSRGRALFLAKHFGAVRGAAWVLTYSVFYPLRALLFGKDSLHQAMTRVKGVRDGFKAARANLEA